MKRVACLLSVVVAVLALGCRKSPPQESVPVPQGAAGVGQAAPAAAPMTQAPPALETVADLPEYAGATRLAFSTKADMEHGWSKVTEVKLSTTAAYQSVFDFYQRTVAEKGWTVTAVESKPGEAQWKLAKGTSIAEVKVDQETGVVEVKLERKDR